MKELSNEMNRLLNEIDKKRWISLSKDSEDLTFKAKDKLRAFGLIERHGNLSWQLTEEGYKAIELGGFEHWKNSRDFQNIDIYKAVLIALKKYSNTGEFIDINKEGLNISSEDLKGVCKVLEKENKLETKANGEYHIDFGNGDSINNKTGKILARIKPEGLNYLEQNNSKVNIGNVSFINGDRNNVNQSHFENSNISKPKQIIKQSESKKESFLEKFWWAFIIPIVIVVLGLIIEKIWFK